MLLGFDIGGTKCAVILGGSSGNGRPVLIDKAVLPTSLPVYEMWQALFQKADELTTTNNGIIDAVGISCGGPLNSRTGRILSPPNLPGWDNIPIVDMVQHRWNCRALLQNDANACAVAEWMYGAGRGYNDVIFLTFGTGMGAGLILNGKLYTGTTDTAGEAGHMRLAPIGPVGFGKAGSFEGFCSGGGIAQLGQLRAREYMQMGKKVMFADDLASLTRLTAQQIAEAANAGDELARSIMAESGSWLGRGIALLVDLLNPECVILGGIYPRAQALLEPTLLAELHSEALEIPLQICKVLPAALGERLGDYAALSLAALALTL